MLYSNKDLRKLIIPLVLEQLLSILVGLVDTIMIAGVGQEAVSGVSLVDTINILIINIFVAFGTGGAVVAGHFLGQKDSDNASKTAWQTNLLSSMLAIFASIVFIAFHDGLLHLVFGQVEEAVMTNAETYLVITAISITPLAVYNACAAQFRAMGNSKITMWISILMNLINICGNAALIYGAKMGTAGAAISTTFSRTVAAIVIFVLMFQGKRAINFKGRVTFRLDRQLIHKILYIGIPNCLENSLFQLGKILTISMVATYGTYAIAANAVCNTLAAFNVLPGIAVNSALLSVVAICVGAGKMEEARYYTKKLMKIATLAMAGMSLLLIVGSGWFIEFYQLSPEAYDTAVKLISYHAIMAVFFWIPSFSLPSTFRAAGDVVWPVSIAIFSMWVFRLLFSYLFGTILGMGVMGVWIAMTIDWVFRGICYVIRFKGNRWESAMNRKKKNV